MCVSELLNEVDDCEGWKKKKKKKIAKKGGNAALYRDFFTEI
jgi:hypothetical protein